MSTKRYRGGVVVYLQMRHDGVVPIYAKGRHGPRNVHLMIICYDELGYMS